MIVFSPRSYKSATRSPYGWRFFAPAPAFGEGMKKAANLSVDGHLVAGAGFEPTTSGFGGNRAVLWACFFMAGVLSWWVALVLSWWVALLLACFISFLLPGYLWGWWGWSDDGETMDQCLFQIAKPSVRSPQNGGNLSASLSFCSVLGVFQSALSTQECDICANSPETSATTIRAMFPRRSCLHGVDLMSGHRRREMPTTQVSGCFTGGSHTTNASQTQQWNCAQFTGQPLPHVLHPTRSLCRPLVSQPMNGLGSLWCWLPSWVCAVGRLPCFMSETLAVGQVGGGHFSFMGKAANNGCCPFPAHWLSGSPGAQQAMRVGGCFRRKMEGTSPLTTSPSLGRGPCLASGRSTRCVTALPRWPTTSAAKTSSPSRRRSDMRMCTPQSATRKQTDR